MTFIAVFFAIMIAFFVGLGMPTLVQHLIKPAPREPRIIAGLWVGIAGIVFFILSRDEMMSEVLTGVAFVGLLVRLLAPYVRKHMECSQAIEEIRLLPTVEERRAYYATLSEDIQAMVDKRTPRPELWKAPAQPTLLDNCANVGLAPTNVFLPSIYPPLEGVDRRI